MDLTYSFRFLDSGLNRKLIELVKKSRVEHFIDKEGAVHYAPDDEETVGNDLICSIRDRVFASWQILTCPSDWVEQYRIYMDRNAVPYREELVNNELVFLIPGSYRPHTWKLDNEAAGRSK